MAKARSIRPKGRSRSSSKEAAAAVAAAGAAVVGGKLAWDKLSNGSGEEPSRAYRIREGEFVPDGIRRLARGQLDSASDELGGSSSRKMAETIHETRKRLKRLRAVLRVAQGALPEDTYRGENAAFREVGQLLSGARDSKVLVETLDGLTDRFRDELSPEATVALRARLEDEHARAIEFLRNDRGAVEAVLGELQAARDRTAGWTFESHGFDALAPGLRRIYRRGRRRMHAATAEPSPENLHEWRKRVKDLWHAVQIVHIAAPKRTKKLAKNAHDLSDLLGDDHDLAELRRYVDVHHECFEGDASRAALVAVIDRRRAALEQQALELGRNLYQRPPKRFVRKLERGWLKRARPER